MHRSVCLAAIAVAVLCCCSVPSSAASSRIAALRAQTSARASVSVPLSDTEKKWLESEWQRLMAAIKAPADKAKKWMDAVFTAYSTGRMYHNLKHVYKMKQIIQTKEFLSKLGSKADVVDLAIWMHDVVYDGKAKDNEEKSAEFSNKMLTELGVSPAVQRDVFDFVMATKTHELPADKREPEAVTALQFFLDSDLEVLSWDWKEYVLYAKDIRQEYIHYDDAAFCKGRQAVLKQLGSKPNLYERPEMRSKLEAKARANLAREIDLLAAKEKDPSKPWPWEASAAPSAPAAAAPPSPRPSLPKGAGGAKLTPAS